MLEYRFKNLYGARIKTKENGFEGALYPREYAWISDGEVTPLWGAADVVTGKTTKLLTGLIEQHIWQSVVLGFGGLRFIGEHLRIDPSLSKEWSNLSFKVIWNQSPLQVTVTATEVTAVNSGMDTEIILGDKMTVIHIEEKRLQRKSNKKR